MPTIFGHARTLGVPAGSEGRASGVRGGGVSEFCRGMCNFSGAGFDRGIRRSAKGVHGAAGRVLALAGLVVTMAGCSSDTTRRSDTYDPKWGVSSSPRIIDNGPVPKGGGSYKVGNPYQVGGRWYYPRHEPAYNQVGVASWYGPGFHGRKTSNGEIFDQHALTAAHKTLPMPSYAYVTNLNNGRTILVRINDRGPYVNDRIIDLSKAAADALGYGGAGLVNVRVRYAGQAPIDGNDTREQRFLASQPWSGARYAAQQPRWTEEPAYAEPSQRARQEAYAAPPPTSQGWSPFAYRQAYPRRSGLGAGQ